jgi:hypothetical protein
VAKFTRLIKEFFALENIVPLVMIALAFLSISGLLPLDFERLTLMLLGFLAINVLIERMTYFRKLEEKISNLTNRRFLRSRTDEGFQDFHHYCGDAQEIFLCALSMGFAVRDQSFVFEERLRHGCSFKLLIANPNLSPGALRMIAEHDERVATTPNFDVFLRSEIETSIKILDSLRTLSDRTGHLELRATKGLPVFTITMVNPKGDNGKMRIEFRPYKRNRGARPYLELKKQEEVDRFWYDFFLAQYYEQLWNDSNPLIQF